MEMKYLFRTKKSISFLVSSDSSITWWTCYQLGVSWQRFLSACLANISLRSGDVCLNGFICIEILFFGYQFHTQISMD